MRQPRSAIRVPRHPVSEADRERVFADILRRHVADEDWQVRALCAQTDPEAFFPERGESNREAKRICGMCTVRDECLAYALRRHEPYGVWGGLSEHERRRHQRREVA